MVSNAVARLVRQEGDVRTGNNITGIQGILVFDEAETIHQLHLGDLAMVVFRKVRLDIGFGSCRERVSGCERRDGKTE